MFGLSKYGFQSGHIKMHPRGFRVHSEAACVRESRTSAQLCRKNKSPQAIAITSDRSPRCGALLALYEVLPTPDAAPRSAQQPCPVLYILQAPSSHIPLLPKLDRGRSITPAVSSLCFSSTPTYVELSFIPSCSPDLLHYYPVPASIAFVGISPQSYDSIQVGTSAAKSYA